MTQGSQRLVRHFNRTADFSKAVKLSPCATCTHYRPLSPASCAKTGGKSSFVGCSGHKRKGGR